MISEDSFHLFFFLFIFGLTHFLQFPLNLALVLLLSLLQLSLQLFESILLFEVCNFEMFVALVFFEEPFHFLWGFKFPIFQVKQFTKQQVISVSFLVSLLKLLYSFFLLFNLIFLLSVFDMATQWILYLVFLILKIFPNGLLDIFNLVLKLYLFFQIFLCLLLHNSSVFAALLLQGRLLFVEGFSGLKLLSDELHVFFFEIYHFLQVLKEIVKGGKVLLVSCFVLGAEFEDYFEPFLLEQALAKLCYYIFFLLE